MSMPEKKKLRWIFAWCLIFLIGWIILLFILEKLGIIIIVNRTHIIKEHLQHLGSSIYFFSANFLLFILGAIKLSAALGEDQIDYDRIKYWDSVINSSIALFFGIGIIYTAVGMQQAFQIALKNLDQDMAQELGPWGILNRLLDGGLLMALSTTIVGSALGYIFKMLRVLVLGPKLIKIGNKTENINHRELIDILSDINKKLTRSQ